MRWPSRRASYSPLWQQTVSPQEVLRKMSSEPTQEAITGREELGDLSKPTQALAQFYCR